MSKIIIDSNVKERTDAILIREESDFVQLCTVKRVSLSEDKKYYEVEVENENGFTNTSRFYLPKNEEDYATKDKYVMATNIFVRNVANLYRRYAGPTATIEANDFVELIEKVIHKITPVLHTKKFYVMFELNKNDKGIFTRIAGIAPFADKKEDLIVSRKQLNLLKEKNGEGVTPDNDAEFMKPTLKSQNTGSKDNLPF